MVKFASALLLASVFCAFTGAQPVNVDGTLARRDYNAANQAAPAPIAPKNRKTVYVTVYETAAPVVVVQGKYSAPASTRTPPGKKAPAPAPAPASTTVASAQPSPTPETPTTSDDWRVEMLNQINAVRAKAGKPALKLDDKLNSMAQDHSKYQNSVRLMTHSDPKGSLGTRYTSFGMSWAGAAENIAVGQKDVSEVVDAWVKSPGHYANIVGNYAYVGFGESNKYWTQDFLST
ncbi:hypothetical protein GGI12_002391 [Dipsacomyces acuminosporus]|nr:hypothetical protein GGI12_002391 [Dipsacomyces acuminosporus]